MDQRRSELTPQPEQLPLSQEIAKEVGREGNVSAEDLVRALAVQQYLAAVPGRQMRDFPTHVRALPGKRLVHVEDDLPVVLAEAGLGKIRFLQLELRILLEKVRDERGLVADALLRGRRERLDGRPGQLRSERRHRGAVRPAAERNADRDVRDQPPLDGFAQRRAKLVRRDAPVPAARLVILAHGQPARVEIEHRVVRRRKHHDVLEERIEPTVGLGPVQIIRDRLAVRTPRNGVGQDRLDLAREDQLAVDETVVQRLFPESVPRQEELAHRRFIERERPHPVELMDALRSPFEVRGQDDLGVGPGAERVSLRLQRLPDLAKVEDFAVERDNHAAAPALVDHRLATQLAQVDDRKPSMPEADVLVGIETFVIGSAMTQGVHHRLHEALVAPTESGDSAHQPKRPS